MQSGDRLCGGCEAAEGVEIEGMEGVVGRECDVGLRSRELRAESRGAARGWLSGLRIARPMEGDEEMSESSAIYQFPACSSVVEHLTSG